MTENERRNEKILEWSYNKLNVLFRSFIERQLIEVQIEYDIMHNITCTIFDNLRGQLYGIANPIFGDLKDRYNKKGMQIEMYEAADTVNEILDTAKKELRETVIQIANSYK